MVRILLYVFLILTVIYGLYFIITAFGSVKKSKKDSVSSDKVNFFAILIAARNEEEVIGNLIKSLKKQNYPKDKYEIYVIVNNCDDNTYDVSKKAGAKVFEATNVKSKGDVLKYAFEKLGDNKEIDAYAIFDADNVVHEDFLTKMNDSINMGYTVVQGFRDTKNIADNWLTSSYALLYYMQSLFINEARYKMGKSSFLNGTGFIISKSVIDNHGYDIKTLTEDIEFTALCALNDEKIGFAKDAITYDEQTGNFVTSFKQRKRWSFGTMQCLKEYFPMLLKKGFKENNFTCFDIAIYYLAVIMQVVSTFIFLAFFVKNLFTSGSFVYDNIIVMIYSTVIFYIVGFLFRLFVIKKFNKNIRDNIGGLLFFDLFVLSWIPVNFISLFIKKCSWEQIKHNRNVNVSE